MSSEAARPTPVESSPKDGRLQRNAPQLNIHAFELNTTFAQQLMASRIKSLSEANANELTAVETRGREDEEARRREELKNARFV